MNLRSVIVLAGLAIVAIVTGGCGQAAINLTPIADWTEFQGKVLKAGQPVLVEFYKDPCPTCVWQQARLDKLAPEYAGRVTFASMKVMEGFFQPTAPEVMKKYALALVPTTILFVNGEEKKRWVGWTDSDDAFRVELDKVARPSATAAPAAAAAATERPGTS